MAVKFGTYKFYENLKAIASDINKSSVCLWRIGYTDLLAKSNNEPL